MKQPTAPTDYIYVPLHIELYADLIRRSGKSDVSGYIDHSVESFLERTEGDPDIWSAEYIEKLVDEEDEKFREKFGDPGRGYHQWHPIFLQNGSELRMSYKGQDYYAEIRHERLWYREESMSPSQFAYHVAGHNRNAWRNLYIKFPGTGSWKLASDVRQQVPAAKAFSLSDF